ncbi:hypothetical protein J4Q44_G00357140 [Coregonus suidteri]|uniref:Secreted protein n=1 Tax=Coregonus suidteri TaxID=861788 RepID=A0AAN8QED0_9TELE
MVSFCLMLLHLLLSGHYYEPSSPQQPPLHMYLCVCVCACVCVCVRVCMHFSPPPLQAKRGCLLFSSPSSLPETQRREGLVIHTHNHIKDQFSSEERYRTFK